MTDAQAHRKPDGYFEDIIARKKEDDCYYLIYKDSGDLVYRLDCDVHPLVWPMNSNLSAYYEHPDGIEINAQEVNKHKIFNAE